MKKFLIALPIFFIAAGFIYQRLIDEKMKSILKQLDLSESYAEEMIWSNCANTAFYYPNPKELKELAMGERTAVVNTLGSYIKEVTSSQTFLQQYKEFKESRKPKEPEKPKSIEQMKQEQKELYTKSIKDAEEQKAKMSKEYQDMYVQTINMYKEQLKQLDDPNNPMFSPEVEKMYQQSYEQQMSEYKNQLAEWEKEYPDNQKELIKKWLNKFLEISKDVDYKAQVTTNKYGKKIFVNEAYETKHSLWKLCYRVGKETADAGRKYAQDWLKTLN